MLRQKIVCFFVTVVVVFAAAASTLTVQSATHSKNGRKLFGGYRITPKPCEPTNPSVKLKSGPKICMFNHECNSRKGEVVGICMDGFLYGTCCQLPLKDDKNDQSTSTLTKEDNHFDDVDFLDHVPDIPILLNPDGTPINEPIQTSSSSSSSSSSFFGGIVTKDGLENAEKPQLPVTTSYAHQTTFDEEKYSTLINSEGVLDNLKLPNLITSSKEQQERVTPNIPINPVTTLLSPDQILQVADPVDQLPGLFFQKLNYNNDSHGSSTSNSIGSSTQEAETILLNENGTALLDHDTNNPDEIFKPIESTTQEIKKTATTRIGISSTNGYDYQEKSSSIGGGNDFNENTIQVNEKSVGTSGGTTPMSLTTRNDDDNDLIRVPTISYAGQTGIKKHEVIDKEEIAINHIISLLNDTNNNNKNNNEPTKTTSSRVTNGPITYTYSASRPTLVKIITSHSSHPSTTESLAQSSLNFYNDDGVSSLSPNYYHYSSGPTGGFSTHGYTSSPSFSSSSFPSQSSTSSQSSGNTKQQSTTNPPAPTLIVLGPLNTDYTTQHTPTIGNYNSNNYLQTKRPTILTNDDDDNNNPLGTTLTHNISTVISGNKQVLSVSYISLDLKDTTSSKPYLQNYSSKRPPTVYTTLTSWSGKPSFQLKPSSSSSSTPNCDTATLEDTPAPDDNLNNFPPVRHPELDGDKSPTLIGSEIVTADEIPTPNFVEDAELNNKVDVFVSKIVESLKDNFENLKDVVYNSKNTTTSTTSAGTVVTKKPAASQSTKRPTKPGGSKVTTRRPQTNKNTSPTTQTTSRPKTTTTTTTTTTIGTRKPTTSKRTKPLKKITTPASTYATATISSSNRPAEIVTSSSTITSTTSTTTAMPEIKPNSDFRSICGIRPLVRKGKIVGGKGATFGEWPWQVLVREATWLGLFTKNKCGGVLITDKFVITAAHCQPGFLASLVAVFGEFDISGELESKRSVTRNVRRVIVNRAYDPATFENDLALLELETPIQFDAHIVPICMPDDNTDYVNRMATVTGWGRLKYNGGVPSVLQEVKVPIMENSVCQEMFQTAGHSKLILESFMCAGYANGQKDSCEGDSGGPLTIQRSDGRWILVGTVSHGIKCAAPYLPGVYMRTTYFKPWLHSITGV